MSVFAITYHHECSFKEDTDYVWEKTDCLPFEELIISWNMTRPKAGSLHIYASLLQETWSPEFLYAAWGKDQQKSFSSPKEGACARVFQDALTTLSATKARGFRIRCTTKDGASLTDLVSIHAATFKKCNEVKNGMSELPSDRILLDVQGLSQMALNDPRNFRLCSPTSTTAVLRFLCQDQMIDPIHFAEKCLDQTFDIFGNWVLNAAEANHYLRNTEYFCYVERCQGMKDLYASLRSGYPIVVSVKGSIEGAPLPYKNGHLLVICGIDTTTKKVLCMDPAFGADRETKTSYSIDSFEAAWKKRHYLTYTFRKKSDLFQKK